jgi:hypothetical protein
MGKVLGDSPKEDFPIPDHVVSLLVDEDPSGECLRPVPMAFVKGTESGMVCNGVGQPRAQVAPPAATPQMPGSTPPLTPPQMPPSAATPVQPPAPATPSAPPAAVPPPLKGQTP